MKKFLLIIAAATVGFLPQLAFCEPPGFIEAAASGPLLTAKMNNPLMDLEGVAQAMLGNVKRGRSVATRR